MTNPSPSYGLKKRLLTGGGWAVFGRLAAVTLALLINILLARLLDVRNMGLYFLTFSLVSILTIIAQAGFNQVLVRLVAESLEQQRIKRLKNIIRSCFMFCLFTTSACVLLMQFGLVEWLAIYIVHSSSLTEASNLLVFWVIAMTAIKLIAECFRGLHDIRYASLFGIVVQSFLFLLALLWLWFYDQQPNLNEVLQWAVWAIYLSLIIAVWCLRNALQRLPESLDECDEKNDNKGKLWQMAWPLMLINVTVFTLSQADLWIVGFFCDKDAVAVYGAASRIAVMMLIVTTLLQAFMPPIIAQFNARKDMQTLQVLLQAGAALNSLLVFPLLLLLIIFPEVILSLLFGNAYMKAHWVMFFLSLGLFVNVLTGMRGYVLMMTGHERREMRIAVVGGAMNILFCSLGAIYAGINGVAVGAMSAMILQCLAELFVVKKTVGIWTWAKPISLWTMGNQWRKNNE